MNFFVEPFTSNEFMMLALIAGSLVSLTCAIAGTFVVLRAWRSSAMRSPTVCFPESPLPSCLDSQESSEPRSVPG